MAKFLRPNKASLKNAQHYSFIQAFLTVLNAAGFSAAKIVALNTQLTDAFAEEDRWYMISRKSELIAQREEADRQRDNLYSRIHAIVRAWAGSGMAQLDDAAKRVKKVFDLYKVKTSAQMDEETGQLDNLIADLSTQEKQADLTTMNLTWLFQQMVAAHEQVKSIRLEEGTEVSEKVPGALAAARKECDRIYDELTYLIEAFSLTADNTEPYEQFIKTWNGTIKIYQDMLDRKSSKSDGKKDDKDKKDDQDGSDDQGGGSDDEGGDGGDDQGGGGSDDQGGDDQGGGDHGGGGDDHGGGGGGGDDSGDDTDGQLPD